VSKSFARLAATSGAEVSESAKVCAMSLDSVVWHEIDSSGRTFLPGRRPSRAEYESHLSGSVLVAGLNREQALLILSTLPSGPSMMYLSELDKGLSGSRVFAARYIVDATDKKSRPFVLKIGPREKVIREAGIIESIVAPTLHGVSPPVVRSGVDFGLIGQDFAGLSPSTSLPSLRQAVRDGLVQPEDAINRLLRDRLSAWYIVRRKRRRFSVGQIAEEYLTKSLAPDRVLIPSTWSQLTTYIEATCGYPIGDPAAALANVVNMEVSSIESTIHGDLHTQNVLMDDRTGECWPIDFAWTKPLGCPLVDLAMLECSLKFLGIPMRSELSSLLKVEQALLHEALPSSLVVEPMPYQDEIARVVRAISEVRGFLTDIAATFEDYLAVLYALTFAMSSHPSLNRPFVLASLYMQAHAYSGTK
jgi:hypothetical protein